jgi:phage gp16-like protein
MGVVMARDPVLAMIHKAKADLALTDDCYRALLARITGQETSKGLSRVQVDAVLAEFRRLGWQAKSADGPRHRPASDKPEIRKVFAIWGDMVKQGIPRTPTRAGLLAYVRRMTGVDDPEWLSPTQAQKVIEGLKSWRARELAARARGA